MSNNDKILQVENQIHMLKKFIGIADVMVPSSDPRRGKIEESISRLETACEAVELSIAQYRDGDISLAQMKEIGAPHVAVIDRESYQFGLMLDEISGGDEFKKEAGEC